MNKYMVIEHFREGCFDAVYERYETKGRMLPQGLVYLNSWVSRNRSVCYQLMKTSDPSLFEDWIASWNDLVEFEIVELE